MRDPLMHTPPAPEEKRNDALLWTGLLLCPLAMGVNTIVGFTVAHWTCDTNQKKFSYLVSVIDFALCVCAFLISWALYQRHRAADENIPIEGRRLFMAKVSMLLSILAALLVIAGTLAVLTLHPCD
jgi:high-affinity Fe2+/Pb2+ permease